eukprot:SAG31_NODE_31633_length_366_cov_0.565543_1_plen_23_part_01
MPILNLVGAYVPNLGTWYVTVT